MFKQLYVSYFFLLIFFIPVHADSHHPEEFLTAIGGHPDEGKQIYNHFCATCHAPKPVIYLGAPSIVDEDTWALRLKQGVAVLFRHVDEGFNAMPPRGGCFECTDKQLMLSIVSMLPKHAKKTLLNQLKDQKNNGK